MGRGRTIFILDSGAVGLGQGTSELPPGKMPFLPLPSVTGRLPLSRCSFLLHAAPHTVAACVGPIGPADSCFELQEGEG